MIPVDSQEPGGSAGLCGLVDLRNRHERAGGQRVAPDLRVADGGALVVARLDPP